MKMKKINNKKMKVSEQIKIMVTITTLTDLLSKTEDRTLREYFIKYLDEANRQLNVGA